MQFSNPIRPPVRILKNDKFGPRSINIGNTVHGGVDLRPVSDDILASHEGVVAFSGKDQFGGLYIDITNGNQRTRYLHNRQNLVSLNQKVQRGQLIGYIGNTGRSSGRHLHFETFIDGKRIDPESVVDFSLAPYIKPAPQQSQPAVISESVPEPTPPVQPPAKTEFIHTVKAGETLSGIIAKHYKLRSATKIRTKYLEIAKINNISDPNKIRVKQKIKLP